jgi:hypothetical protein
MAALLPVAILITNGSFALSVMIAITPMEDAQLRVPPLALYILY